MLDIGILEIFLVLAVALFAIGPDKLPEAARAIGRIARTLKGMVQDLKDGFENLEDTPDKKQTKDDTKSK